MGQGLVHIEILDAVKCHDREPNAHAPTLDRLLSATFSRGGLFPSGLLDRGCRSVDRGGNGADHRFGQRAAIEAQA